MLEFKVIEAKLKTPVVLVKAEILMDPSRSVEMLESMTEITKLSILRSVKSALYQKADTISISDLEFRIVRSDD